MNASQTATIDQVDVTEQELTSQEKCMKIVYKNMYWAMGLSLVPVPFFDLVGVAAFQAKAIKEIAHEYDVTFSHDLARNLVATLISGLGASSVGVFLASSMAKLIPGIGTAIGMAGTPVAAAALTYAIGKVFIAHFETGGTLLTFDPDKMREYFKEELKEGSKVASTMAKEKDAPKKS